MSARRGLDEYGDVTDDEVDEFTEDDEENVSVESEPNIPKVADLSEPNISFSCLVDRMKWFGVGSILLIVTAMLMKYYNPAVVPQKATSWSAEEVLRYLTARHEDFPSQDENLNYEILGGLQAFHDDRIKPAVYLLLHEEQALSTSSCIAALIATTANKFLFRVEKGGWLLISGKELSLAKTSDLGVLLEEVSNSLAQSTHKILVITDLQDVPPNLAEAFHWLLDTYNPKTADAIYILTMGVPSGSVELKPSEVAENTLESKWKKLKSNVLYPLITRVVSGYILPIIREKKIMQCTLSTNSSVKINIP